MKGTSHLENSLKADLASVERTWIRTGGYGRFRGEWVKKCQLQGSLNKQKEPALL